ncbi:NAPA isoform 19 [Pan troglodytes]|uniref:NSF attachment protein alpha n=5 Tax=Homininae TaxID=207598 RepID=M0R031_HUMAN|nr:NSF attachment protein alpha [Homo sapiens]KAI4043642.1 NSF attachment protein alpha [Homo sapiens]PNI28969.1 NAPA isoform 19 [Pan troglodytes]
MDNSGKEAEAMALLAEAERKVKNSQSFFSGLFGCWKRVLPGCTAAPAAPEQARRSHLLCGRWQRIQESRPPRGH